MSRAGWRGCIASIVAVVAFAGSGCTGPVEYIRNGFKVGPNACVPAGATAPCWIDAADQRVHEDPVDLSQWWTAFNDPMLNQLVENALHQNLTLREAGYRVLEARAQFWIAQGNLFPQSQSAFGAYQRLGASKMNSGFPSFGKQFYDQWNFGFNLSWELDFWGRFRRAVDSAEYTLEASCANYEDVLVTLLGDVAQNYVLARTLQQRIKLVESNVDLQRKIMVVADRRFEAGRKNALDSHQARSNLGQTASQIPQLRIELRQACNRLCVLLGVPPGNLEEELGEGPIPTAPPAVALGIPADLLRRRPDIRRAQHQAEAQAEQIGIALADLYPMIAVNGTLGYQASNFPQMFSSGALNSTVGPQFQWNILNYGRIINNKRAQEAKFWALVMAYQNKVLQAGAEVENGLVAYLRAQERAKWLDTSVNNSKQAVDIVFKEYRVGTVDFNRVALIEQNLVQQQDLQAQSYGEIVQGLIQVYRALGGGWEMTPSGPNAPEAAPTPAVPNPEEIIPAPSPEVSNVPGRRIPPTTEWKMPTPSPSRSASVETNRPVELGVHELRTPN